ncbi:MAG: AraC family transcriptional regulator [bacterium]|nr:AraC family transcriptional regulator [bacterium]
MNYITFCKKYFAATNLPVCLMKGRDAVYSSGEEILPVEYAHFQEVFWDVPDSSPNPTFCRFSPELEYGCVHIEGTDYRIIIGPSFSIPVTEEIIRAYMSENAMPLEHREAIAEFLFSIPLISHSQFSDHLALLHLILNQKEMGLDDFFPQDEQHAQEREEQHQSRITDREEPVNAHNTYYFEQELYQHIKNGDTQKLDRFLSSCPASLSEGKLARTPLRHAKNLFILTAAKAGMLGAIPGGADIEKTYCLIDLYIQECEQLLTIESVKSLQYAMLKDFCRRTGETHLPEGISSEVWRCINYIRSHTNESISINDVADQIHRSSSYTAKLFKEELGINMGAFITRCKLEEARSLLSYSKKSLAEISSYLCFSSQSYFQNVFKKKYGVTPMQYRREARKNNSGV